MDFVDGLIFVLVPLMVKKLLDLNLKLFVENLAVIEFAKKAEKSSELISFIEIFVDLLKVVQHLDKDAHNVRENSHTEKQNDGAKNSFSVRNRVKVSEPNRR